MSNIPSLALTMSFLSTADRYSCGLVSRAWNKEVKPPHLLQQGLYGARFMHRDGPLFLRLEEVTEQNSENWGAYKEWTYQMAGVY